MRFNRHSDLAGRHAYLSPSSPAWSNYDDDKLARSFVKHRAAIRGTQLHQLAHDLINLNQKLPANQKTLNRYVNDAIGFRMTPEVALFYSDNAFGHADCLAFRKNKLRIHDLKTGENPTSVRQLEIYAALFCLEYRFKPHDIEIDLRIYQNDEVHEYITDPHDIVRLMDTIVAHDKRILSILMEELT